jgi:CubicO group peptidase (beta-lactamase class C family)
MNRQHLFVPIAAAVLASAFAAIGCKKASSPETRVDEVVRHYATENGPALAIAVVQDGHVKLAKTWGFSDIATKAPATTKSVFNLASFAMQMTGASVMLLEKRGQLSLDDDVRKYVPEIPAWDEANPIRIRDLASHTSGLPEFVRTKDDVKNADTNDVIAWLAQQKAPAFARGDRWRFTNSNYIVLSRVIEKASGKSYAEFLRSEIFAPAHMTNAQVLEKPDATIADRVTGYCVARQPCRYDPATLGDGGVFASVDDMIAWDGAWRSGVLPEAELRAALDGTWPYAFGWGVRDGVMWDHGSWLGAETYIARSHDPDLTVIVLSAQYKLDVELLGKQVAAIFKRAAAEDETRSAPSAPSTP